MEVRTNNGTFFNELNRRVKYEYDARNMRAPSIANTRQNEPQFQRNENLSRNYMRVGDQKFADPFAFKSRFDNGFYNGRNLNILDTIKYNSKRNFPDVITQTPLKVVGFY
jgi:hypothetical protein